MSMASGRNAASCAVVADSHDLIPDACALQALRHAAAVMM